MDFKGQDAIATWKADGDKTSSPNAGQTMSIMAGLLSIKLEKSGEYTGLNTGGPGPQTFPAAYRSVNSRLFTLVLAALGLAWI